MFKFLALQIVLWPSLAGNFLKYVCLFTAVGLSSATGEIERWGNMSVSEASLLYHCDNGEWILSRYICDGKTDCRDGSDEESCSSGERNIYLQS